MIGNTLEESSSRTDSLSSTRRWFFLRQGSQQCGQVCQVCGEKWVENALRGARVLSFFVERYGTEQGSLSPDEITNVRKLEFDCHPGAVVVSLAFTEPKYQETVVCCHSGREPSQPRGRMLRGPTMSDIRDGVSSTLNFRTRPQQETNLRASL